MPLADEMRAKIEAGQPATADALRTLADRIESLPLGDAAEVMNWLAPHLERPARRLSGRATCNVCRR
jgi:hypothetical protein